MIFVVMAPRIARLAVQAIVLFVFQLILVTHNLVVFGVQISAIQFHHVVRAVILVFLILLAIQWMDVHGIMEFVHNQYNQEIPKESGLLLLDCQSLPPY